MKLNVESLESRRLLAADCIQFPDWDVYEVAPGETVELDLTANDTKGAKIDELGLYDETKGTLELNKNRKSVTFTAAEDFDGLLFFQYLGSARGGKCEYLGDVQINSTVPEPPALVSVDLFDGRINGEESTLEGDEGAKTMWFWVLLSEFPDPFFTTITVDYATSDGTAVAGEDYEAISGTITWEPALVGLLVFIPVQIYGDFDFEDDEAFFLEISNPINAEINDGVAVGNIINDDFEAEVAAALDE